MAADYLIEPKNESRNFSFLLRKAGVELKISFIRRGDKFSFRRVIARKEGRMQPFIVVLIFGIA